MSWLAVRFTAVAQSVKGLEQIAAEMKKVQMAYKAHPLSFKMRYTYAGVSAPEKVLDSLAGQMEMAGNNYRCVLDSTETIRNDRYNIILFKEDRVMYLSKPSAAAVGTDPVQLMQSLLERAGAATCELSQQAGNRILKVLFKEGSAYLQMEMTIDTLSGYITGMRYVVKTALLMGQDNGNLTGEQKYDEFAIVQLSYEAYRIMPADPSRFDERLFFHKEGNEFVTTQAYKNYKLFVGTPNL